LRKRDSTSKGEADALALDVEERATEEEYEVSAAFDISADVPKSAGMLLTTFTVVCGCCFDEEEGRGVIIRAETALSASVTAAVPLILLTCKEEEAAETLEFTFHEPAGRMLGSPSLPDPDLPENTSNPDGAFDSPSF